MCRDDASSLATELGGGWDFVSDTGGNAPRGPIADAIDGDQANGCGAGRFCPHIDRRPGPAGFGGGMRHFVGELLKLGP